MAARESSNTAKGRGKRGSKFWMQIVVEFDDLKKQLDKELGEPVNWISPIEGPEFEFKEYKLKDKPVLDALQISDKEEIKEIFDFWPSNQPQWDGIAISEDGKSLYLVEAKAHTSEMNSKISATSEESKNLIKTSMKEVQEGYHKGDFDVWINKYYQLGNRLTFLNKLQKVKFEEVKQVKLVLLNFVEDNTYSPTTEKEWDKHYKEVWKVMIGQEDAPKDVIVVNYLVPKTTRRVM